MAIKIECDGGCGTTVASEDDFVKFGHFKLGYYCDDCHESVAAYYAARDALHTKVSKTWQTGDDKLATKWLADHPGGVLPDAT